MKVSCNPRRLAWTSIRVLVFGILFQVSFPFLGGVYYSMCGDHSDEQHYLDDCISHLKIMRAACDDPDLQGILDYTIHAITRSAHGT